MYLPGQVIYDLVDRKPVKLGDDVWDEASYPKHAHTHFIKPTGRFWQGLSEYIVFAPRTIAEADKLLRKNKIVPAPDDSMTDELEVPTVDWNTVKHKLINSLRDVDVERG